MALTPTFSRAPDIAPAPKGILDPATGRPALAAGGGGYSGRGIHPVAVRAVFDTHAAHPDLPIIGVGGVASGWDAAELMLAGASAVQVGTATFADPVAPARVQRELLEWCARHGVSPVDMVGLAHRGGLSRPGLHGGEPAR